MALVSIFDIGRTVLGLTMRQAQRLFTTQPFEVGWQGPDRDYMIAELKKLSARAR
jgi:hypothetical protein